MTDVRSLLKAKRQEIRISHPLAAYSSSGQLRCIACDAPVKHSSAWEGHIGSKAHRIKAAKHREVERAALLRAQAPPEPEPEPTAHGKRRAEDDEMDTEEALPEKKRRITAAEQPPSARGGLPTDFFSNPALAPSADEEDEENQDGAPAAPNLNSGPPAEIDLEWQKFQEAVLNPPDQHETYERATVFAEPELASEVPEGFPPSLQGVEGEAAAQEEEDEETKRRRKQQEERELIMDRLLEEERAQEEADEKVTMLKNKLDLIRKQREARKAAKAKNS